MLCWSSGGWQNFAGAFDCARAGKIVQSMCKADTSNPLILLDEIDKMSADFRGDPGSALLEVLDPEQNRNFHDLYMEIDYDLSKALFICTANSLSISQPLLDRMKVIELSGYTEEEKINIARAHLLPKQLVEHGYGKKQVGFTNAAYKTMINGYTREAGVRALEKAVGKTLRKGDVKRRTIKIGAVCPTQIAIGCNRFQLGIAQIERCGQAMTIGS